jgi:hypothetical protein
MTGWRKRQVVELAERASPSKQDWWKDDDALEAFAELVRKDEREKFLGVLRQLHDSYSLASDTSKLKEST